MPVPEKISPLTAPGDVCSLAARWILDPRLAERLVMMAGFLPFGLSIISGFRSVAQQMQLKEEGRPAADPAVSTHCSCPATGADLRIDGVEAGNYEKALFGAAAVSAGLRWGGGSPVDVSTGIPSDWNHVDLGPRNGG